MTGKDVAVEIIRKFNIEDSIDNRGELMLILDKFAGNKKRKKVVSFDENGNQINIFDSLSEASEERGVSAKRMWEVVKKQIVSQKNGLRYCYLSDFGKFSKLKL